MAQIISWLYAGHSVFKLCQSLPSKYSEVTTTTLTNNTFNTTTSTIPTASVTDFDVCDTKAADTITTTT